MNVSRGANRVFADGEISLDYLGGSNLFTGCLKAEKHPQQQKTRDMAALKGLELLSLALKMEEGGHKPRDTNHL